MSRGVLNSREAKGQLLHRWAGAFVWSSYQVEGPCFISALQRCEHAGWEPQVENQLAQHQPPALPPQQLRSLSLLGCALLGPGLSNKVGERCTRPRMTSYKLKLLSLFKSFEAQGQIRRCCSMGHKAKAPLPLPLLT